MNLKNILSSFRAVIPDPAKQSLQDTEAAKRGFQDLVARYGGQDDLSQLNKLPIVNYNQLFNAATTGKYEPAAPGNVFGKLIGSVVYQPMGKLIDPNQDKSVADGLLSGIYHRYQTAALQPDFTPLTLEQYRTPLTSAAPQVTTPQTGVRVSPLSIIGRLLTQLKLK